MLSNLATNQLPHFEQYPADIVWECRYQDHRIWIGLKLSQDRVLDCRWASEVEQDWLTTLSQDLIGVQRKNIVSCLTRQKKSDIRAILLDFYL